MTLAINVMKCASWVCFASAFINGVYAQSANTPYPNKPIRIIVPYPPGAGTDFTAREMGKGINEACGQPVVMEPTLAENLFAALREGARTVEDMGHPAVLVVSPVIRGWLSKAARFRVNDLTVLSYSEIPDDQAVKVIHTVDAKKTND